MNALRIALINTFYPPYNFGGDGIYLRRFAHALARRGCEVHVLHDTDTYKALARKPLGDLAPLPEPEGVTVHALKSTIGPLATLITQQTGRPLANQRAISEFFEREFDVTHFHNVSSIGGPGILSNGSGVRLYTAHEHWLVCPTHILWRNNSELCDARQCTKCQLIYRRPPQLWRHTSLLESQARKIDSFIALSQSSADNHRRFGFEPEMTVLPSFIPDAPTPVRSKTSDRPYALFVGRLEKLKGLQEMIPAFRAAPDVDLLIVGDGDYRPALEALGEGAANIKFLGRRAPEELDSLYANAAAVLMPSVCYEVFPLVALEAFRAGAPIVARKLGPFPEIVEATGGGMLFETADEAVAAVQALATDPERRAQMGAQARAGFDERWTEEIAMRAYFNHVSTVALTKGLDLVAKKARALANLKQVSA